MEQFLGQRVSLHLADDTVLQGTIAEVDEARQVLKLSGASSHGEGAKGRNVFPGLLEVLAADIINIDFIHVDDHLPTPPMALLPAVSSSASSTGKSTKTRSRNSEWAKDDIRRIKGEDFDFQSNLKLFNKEQIFSEIHSQDQTDIKARLVSHNLSGKGQERRQQKEDMQRKLLPRENVLDSTDNESSDRIIQRGMSSVSLRSDSPPHLVTANNSVPVRLSEDPLVKKEELYRPMFPFMYLMVENAGRSVAAHILFHHNQCKEVLLSLGLNFRRNAIGVSAARHLASKGIAVVIEEPIKRGKGAEDAEEAEEFLASVYRDQRAAISALFPTMLRKAVGRTVKTIHLSCCGEIHSPHAIVYLEYCSVKPSQSTSLFFDPFLPLSVLESTSRIFLLDAGLPGDRLPIHIEALFREAFEVQLLKE